MEITRAHKMFALGLAAGGASDLLKARPDLARFTWLGAALLAVACDFQRIAALETALAVMRDAPEDCPRSWFVEQATRALDTEAL